MKIITFAAIKGGVGKTTLAFNYGELLAEEKNKKVLFIDADHQCNLSQTYNVYDNEGTVANIFSTKGEVTIHEIKKNIYLIAGFMKLDELVKDLENKSNKDMLLYMWLEDNYTPLGLEKFDYVILDCHPDFATATRNAIAISHAIISPIIPSEHGYSAKFNLENRLEDFKNEVVDYKTRKSYITARLYFLANRIKHNTKSSKELMGSLENEENVMESIPEKELFNRSTLDKQSISEMKSDVKLYNQHRDFFELITNKFENIYDVIIEDEK